MSPGALFLATAKLYSRTMRHKRQHRPLHERDTNEKRMAAAVLTIVASASLIATPAQAGGPNYGKAWETLKGAKWNGYVQIVPSYNDKGKHARQGYHRFTRDAGPSLDTGRMYTEAARSKSDRRTLSRQDWVWDSPIWGDRFTTRYNWGYSSF